MKKLIGEKDEKVVYFDCDDTLVMWEGNHTQPSEGRIALVDPLDGETYYLYPHKDHVRLVKHFYFRDYYVVVHSASGGRWAKAVVEALGLDKYVHDTMAKPLKYVDDLNCTEWMGNRVFIPFKKVEE